MGTEESVATEHRIFDRKTKEQCWQRAPTVNGRDPRRWRRDVVGNTVCHELRGCLGCLCHEYDHVVPYSRGGPSTLDNCQILQTRINRFKGNDYPDDASRLRAFGCARQFSPVELDTVEMALYGDIRDEHGQLRCRVKSNFELFAALAVQYKLPKKLADSLVDNCP